MAKYERTSQKGIRVSGNVVGMAARPGAWLISSRLWAVCRWAGAVMSNEAGQGPLALILRKSHFSTFRFISNFELPTYPRTQQPTYKASKDKRRKKVGTKSLRLKKRFYGSAEGGSVARVVALLFSSTLRRTNKKKEKKTNANFVLIVSS